MLKNVKLSCVIVEIFGMFMIFFCDSNLCEYWLNKVWVFVMIVSWNGCVVC